MQTVQFRVGDAGDVVLVEMSETDADPDDGMQRAGFNNVLRKASLTFEAAVATIRPVADSIVAQLAGMSAQPAEVTLSFGLKLSGSTSAKIVSAGAESHIDVSLKWIPGNRGAPEWTSSDRHGSSGSSMTPEHPSDQQPQSTNGM